MAEFRAGRATPRRLCSHRLAQRDAAPDHLASDLFEAPPRILLTLVDEFDSRVRTHRTNNDRGQTLADRLIDKIFVVFAAPDRPFEADRLHRTGPDLRVAVCFHWGDGW